MKAIIKVGTVYKGVDNRTHFEVDERYEIEVEDIDILKSQLKKEYDDIYDIYINYKNIIIALVY